MQTSALNEKLERVIKPEQDLREIQGVVAEEKAKEEVVKQLSAQGISRKDIDNTLSNPNFNHISDFTNVIKKCPELIEIFAGSKTYFVNTGNGYLVEKNFVNKNLYETVMGKAPSSNDGYTLDEAKNFCNSLNKLFNKETKFRLMTLEEAKKFKDLLSSEVEWTCSYHHGGNPYYVYSHDICSYWCSSTWPCNFRIIENINNTEK